jgi:hypothetical protein
MGSQTPIRLLGIGTLCAAAAFAQETVLPVSAFKITLAKDSPVAFLTLDPRDSRYTARGAAIMVDLDALLTLRNSSPNRIHGITLRVVSQEVTMGGKASMCIPRLNIGPGESFPIHIVQHLVRPTAFASGPLVEVSLDGVLFQDLSFYGPDQIHSRRDMIAWEKEAQRDRDYFKQILAHGGRTALQQAVLQEMTRIADRPQLDRPMMLRGPAVASSATTVPARTERFAFVSFPDSPVEPVSGTAVVVGDQVSTPHIEVRNRGHVPVSHVEVGWLVKDPAGRLYLAASVPSSQPDLQLAAGQTAAFAQDTSMKISRNGQPLDIRGMTGFISQVEFADGKVWVPSRQNLDDTVLRAVLPPSAEVLRLIELYRKGPDALIAELNKP